MTEPRRTANRHPEITQQIREIFADHAMLVPGTRRPLLCAAGPVELAFHPHGNPYWRNNDAKICFPSDEQAWDAAHAINGIDGADKVYAYRCPRGGHAHHGGAVNGMPHWARQVHLMHLAALRASP